MQPRIQFPGNNTGNARCIKTFPVTLPELLNLLSIEVAKTNPGYCRFVRRNKTNWRSLLTNHASSAIWLSNRSPGLPSPLNASSTKLQEPKLVIMSRHDVLTFTACRVAMKFTSWRWGRVCVFSQTNFLRLIKNVCLLAAGIKTK